MLPTHLSHWGKKQVLKLSASYYLVQHDLFYIGPDLVICMCVCKDKIFDILKYCHDKPCGEHFADKITAYKFIHMSYF